MRKYLCLDRLAFHSGNFLLESIRDEDQSEIMNIRNAQLYHLRQAAPLSTEKQRHYFSTVVANLFKQEQPNQLLFSFFEKGTFIGYGGLVHINWTDRNAEISFVMKTELEKDHFEKYWSNYLNLIEQVAFDALNFHKIFTYAFDVRPHLYPVLTGSGYHEEARLKEHCFFDGRFLDVVYHAKFNRNVTFRKANPSDMLTYFNWTNDASVRENSYQSKAVTMEDHQNWFNSKIEDPDCQMLIFENHSQQAIGQVRIEKIDDKTAIIGISNDSQHRGKGYAGLMITMATDEFLKQNPEICVSAYIKLDNQASAKAFEKGGYVLDVIKNYENVPSYHYIKKL